MDRITETLRRLEKGRMSPEVARGQILSTIADYLENTPLLALPPYPFETGTELDALQIGCFYRGVSDYRESIIQSLKEL